MKLRRTILLIVASLSLGCGGKDTPSPATAPTRDPILITLVQLTSQGINTGPATAGQSVSVAGGPFDNLRFRFLVPPFGEPANGALFLLSREYLGSQQNLGPATPGFIASTTRLEDGEWVFDPGVRITAGTYWFMAQSPMRIYTTQGNNDFYPGGDVYTAGLSGPFVRFTPFALTDRCDALFQLRGNQAQ